MAAAQILMIGSFSASNSSSSSNPPPPPRCRKATENLVVSTNRFSTTVRTQRCLLVRASEPQQEEPNTNSNDTFFTSQEDLDYLWKLGAGSIVSAAVIKYGSIFYPEMTKPNILQALVMISTPVIVAVLLLIKQSRLKE